MNRRLENKVVVVTGGSSGIGRSASVLLSRDGAKVLIADVLVDGGEETVRMIKDAGGDAIFVKADVSRAAEVEAFVRKTVETYGRLDCAFNNAGINTEGDERPLVPLAELDEEVFDRIMSVNLRGVCLCMKYEIRQMLKQGRGAIVVTASLAGLHGSATDTSAYVASKHGVIGLVKNAALEYAKAGIRVNAVCPGATRTAIYESASSRYPQLEEKLKRLIPMGRIGEPEEIGETVAWLFSDAASYITGQSITVDGGWKV